MATSTVPDPIDVLAAAAVQAVRAGVPLTTGLCRAGCVIDDDGDDPLSAGGPVFRQRAGEGETALTLEAYADEDGRVVEMRLVRGHVSDSAPVSFEVEGGRFGVLAEPDEHPMLVARADRWIAGIESTADEDEPPGGLAGLADALIAGARFDHQFGQFVAAVASSRSAAISDVSSN